MTDAEIKKRARGSWLRDQCFICLRERGDLGFVYHSVLGVYAHDGACSSSIDPHYRDFSDSKRGRWRSKMDVLRLVAAELQP